MKFRGKVLALCFLVLVVCGGILWNYRAQIVDALTGPINMGGTDYYVVLSSDPTEDSGNEACAKVGRTCVGYTNFTTDVCTTVHPTATVISNNGSGDKSGVYCNGAPQAGICASLINTCTVCPACNVGISCSDTIGGLYREMYVECGSLVGSVPSAVTDLNASAGSGQAVLTWSAPADNGSAITDYVVQYGATSGFPGNAVTFSDGVNAGTGATVTGLSNGTNYSFRVAAVNGIGTGAYSNTASTTPVAVPAAVSDLLASAGNIQVTLTWSAPANNGSAITDYVVQYGATSGFPGNASIFNDGVSANTGATVTGLSNGTDYSFRVAAVNGVGTGPTSNVETSTPSAASVSETQFNVDVNDFLSFSISNPATGDEPAGDQPLGAGTQITDLTSTGTNAYAVSGSFGSPVYTQLQTVTNSADGYNVTAYASDAGSRTTTLLRTGGAGGVAADEIPDTLSALAASQAANDTLSTSTDTGIAFRLTDANTSSILREANEDTQWGNNDTTNALWASFPLGSGAAQIIYSTTTYSSASTTAFINWFVGVSSTQQSGSYSGQVTFTASVN